ncbi:MAG: hypothetical protein JST37_01270 [Bacteroidetes bacterium]|nr:hypothetical protein [Bacteroidota bacterium]
MKNFFLLIGFVLSGPLLPGQATDDSGNANVTFYYNSKWELTTPEKSIYKRIAQFDLYDMMFNGVYKDYDKEEHLIGDGYYDHGKLSGIQSQYYINGSTKTSVEYANNDFTIWQLANEDNQLSVARGTGAFTTDYYYFFDWKLKRGTMTGEFRNGVRTGTWIYEDANKRITDKEVYANGKLVSRFYFQGDDSIAVPRKKEIILSFRTFMAELLSFDKESFTNLNQYMETQVHYPPAFQRQFTYSGGLRKLLLLLAQQAQVADKNLVLVRLKIDEHGSVLKKSVMRSVDDETDARVLKAIEIHSPYFFPPMKDGKAYSSVIYLPVAGGDEWMDMINHTPPSWFLDVNNFY